ncbi:hypothetical protein CGZ80_01805 [Rhodopirellula sp. MGV]|nr:hypothetical protein CGZ80_01805 [Rhodopirellula sp. MGV]PNY34846.1 hypothetical protein C2E31_21640 [Rhodopirellula baltica]
MRTPTLDQAKKELVYRLVMAEVVPTDLSVDATCKVASGVQASRTLTCPGTSMKDRLCSNCNHLAEGLKHRSLWHRHRTMIPKVR